MPAKLLTSSPPHSRLWGNRRRARADNRGQPFVFWDYRERTLGPVSGHVHGVMQDAQHVDTVIGTVHDVQEEVPGGPACEMCNSRQSAGKPSRCIRATSTNSSRSCRTDRLVSHPAHASSASCTPARSKSRKVSNCSGVGAFARLAYAISAACPTSAARKSAQSLARANCASSEVDPTSAEDIRHDVAREVVPLAHRLDNRHDVPAAQLAHKVDEGPWLLSDAFPFQVLRLKLVVNPQLADQFFRRSGLVAFDDSRQDETWLLSDGPGLSRHVSRVPAFVDVCEAPAHCRYSDMGCLCLRVRIVRQPVGKSARQQNDACARPHRRNSLRTPSADCLPLGRAGQRRRTSRAVSRRAEFRLPPPNSNRLVERDRSWRPETPDRRSLDPCPKSTA